MYPTRLQAGMPAVIVDDSLFQQLNKDKDPRIQLAQSTFIGINVKHEDQMEKANELFNR